MAKYPDAPERAPINFLVGQEVAHLNSPGGREENPQEANSATFEAFTLYLFS